LSGTGLVETVSCILWFCARPARCVFSIFSHASSAPLWPKSLLFVPGLSAPVMADFRFFACLAASVIPTSATASFLSIREMTALLSEDRRVRPQQLLLYCCGPWLWLLRLLSRPLLQRMFILLSTLTDNCQLAWVSLLAPSLASLFAQLLLPWIKQARPLTGPCRPCLAVLWWPLRSYILDRGNRSYLWDRGKARTVFTRLSMALLSLPRYK
jgi:hypothetical protein